MLLIRYILLSFFLFEKCLQFSFTFCAIRATFFREVGVTGVYLNFSGVHFRKFKGDLKISKSDIHRWSLIDSSVNDLMYAFSSVLKRKKVTQVLIPVLITVLIPVLIPILVPVLITVLIPFILEDP